MRSWRHIQRLNSGAKHGAEQVPPLAKTAGSDLPKELLEVIDSYVLLAPILLVGVVALMGFVGCDIVWRVDAVPPRGKVAHLQTVTTTGTGTTLVASLPDLGGGKSQLIVVTVEWGGNATVTLSGSTFTQIEIDNLNPQMVATFFANNVTGAIAVTATLSAPTTTEANLLVSAYNVVGGDPDAAGSAHGSGTDAVLPMQTSGLSAGDLVYSVAIARSSGAVLSGALVPGLTPSFTAEGGQGSYHLVQDYVLEDADVAAGQINVTATNTTGTPASLWYLFAMRIPRP